MAAPATPDEFVELVRKSGVLEDKKLDVYVDKLRTSDAMPAEPSALSARMVRDGILTGFQAEQFMLGKWKRFSVGKYKVLERLGSGGMGSVFLCEHKLMRRRVAVKILPTAKAEDPSSLERFYREAKAIAALDHPNIVRAYDIDQDEKLHFIVMEYVDGASLQEMVKAAGPMDVTRAAHYMRQAALGLQHAHDAAGLVHRDIKPGNILVDRTGCVKILDMGLARFFHDEEDILTKKYDENVLGTADYLAPEQALDSHGVDIRADIYSLGATFYYCLTGRTPFTEGSVAQKLIWHQTRQPKPIRSLRPEVPEGLAAVVEKTMAKDPGHRYQTPAEVAEALAPFTEELIGPPPESEMPRRSPAVMGSNMPASDVSSGPSTPGSSVTGKKNWQVPPSPSPAPAMRAAAPSAPPASPRATPVQAAAPTRSPSRPPAAPPATRPVNNGQSMPAPPPRPAPAPIPAPPRLASPVVPKREPGQKAESTRASAGLFTARPWLWWVVIGLGVVIVAGLVYGLGMLAFGKRQGNKGADSTSSGRAPLVVSRLQPQAFRSIREALAKAGPGDHVLVMDEGIQEQLYLEGRKWDAEVVLESGLQKPVVWSAPSGFDAESPLVSLVNVGGLHIKGFTFDGEDRVAEGVRFLGHCPGLILDNVLLQRFRTYEVRLLNCEGEKERKLELTGVHTVTTRPKKYAALTLTILKDIPAIQQTQELIVRDCKFEGPYSRPVEVSGSVDRSEWVHNTHVIGDQRVALPPPW